MYAIPEELWLLSHMTLFSKQLHNLYVDMNKNSVVNIYLLSSYFYDLHGSSCWLQ